MQHAATTDHAIVDILIVDGDKYLLVMEGKPGRQGLFNLPGGHIEPHETIAQAAIREAKEETGYDVQLTGLVGIYQGIYPRINVSGPVLSAKIVGGSAMPSSEHPQVRWVTQKKLRALAKDGKLFTAYPPLAVEHFEQRGAYPLEAITSLRPSVK
jgi:ADP-ribose pyrophosphatase YjhB (NUDIX family)